MKLFNLHIEEILVLIILVAFSYELWRRSFFFFIMSIAVFGIYVMFCMGDE